MMKRQCRPSAARVDLVDVLADRGDQVVREVLLLEAQAGLRLQADLMAVIQVQADLVVPEVRAAILEVQAGSVLRPLR